MNKKRFVGKSNVNVKELNNVKAAIESQISTLAAYRKSLIHECVTGQRRVTAADVLQAQNGRAPI